MSLKVSNMVCVSVQNMRKFFFSSHIERRKILDLFRDKWLRRCVERSLILLEANDHGDLE